MNNILEYLQSNNKINKIMINSINKGINTTSNISNFYKNDLRYHFINFIRQFSLNARRSGSSYYI